MKDKVTILKGCDIHSIVGLMTKWGFTSAPDPGYRRGKLWWAGFTKGGKSVYAWEATANGAVRQAAIDAIREAEK